MLKVGYSQVNANPPLGIGIEGYFVPRVAKGFLDDIEVISRVLTCGDTTVAVVSVDVCFMNEDLIDRFCMAAEKATGIKKENIFLSATHTHTGPLLKKTNWFEADWNLVYKYVDFLENRIADSLQLALADVKPARMGFITGYAPERVAYIRRYRMKDGSTMTCPPINDPNIEGPIGQLDQRVHVLRFDREGGCSIVVVNYGLHCDTVNGELLSADWPGWMRRTLEKTLDGTKCLFICGAQGDVGSTHVSPCGGDMNDTEISFDNEMKSPGMARFVGRALAGTVLQVYDKVEYVDVDEIKLVNKVIPIAANVPKPEEMPLAREYKRLHDEGRDDLIPYTAMELTTVVAEALRMCKLENGPEHFDLRLTGLKLGPVVLVGIPGEPFTEVGVRIKENPDYRMIMPCGLVNGYLGYFPVQSAYDEGGYEARSSKFRAGVAERIVDGAAELLAQMRG